MAKPIFAQLIQKGNVSRGWMGVTIQPVTEELAKSFGLKQARGALINDIMKGSPAEKAGIRQGDVITVFNGADVKDPSHLQRLVAETGIGKPVKVNVFRDGRALELSLTLTSSDMAPKQRSGTGGGESQGRADQLGLVVDDSEEGDGAVVVDVSKRGAAAEAGIRRGDVIVSVNRTRVADAADYQRAVRLARPGSTLTVLVQRGDANIYFALRPR
jgi:serine protease Do/serine protease DegQ